MGRRNGVRLKKESSAQYEHNTMQRIAKMYFDVP